MRPGIIGSIQAGATFPNFSISGLRRLVGTGPIDSSFDDDIPEVAVIRLGRPTSVIVYWLCFDCGGVDSYHCGKPAPELGDDALVINNPCPAGRAPARIAIRLRPEGETPPTLGVMGW